MWVLDHLEDLESDFNVFHRVEDIYSLPGPLFFSRANRITAYAGVMQAIASEQADKTQKKYGTTDIQHKSLDELAKSKGGSELFEREEV